MTTSNFYNQYKGLATFINGVDFENQIWVPQRYPKTETQIDDGGNFIQGIFWPDYPSESITMVRADSKSAMGWVHNRSVYWGNLGLDCQCITNSPCIYSSCGINLDEDDEQISSPQSYSNQKTPIHHLQWQKKYVIEFYDTQTGIIISSLTKHSDIFSNLHLPIPTVSVSQPDFAYKVYRFGSTLRESEDSNIETDTLTCLTDSIEIGGMYESD